ncbi:MAG: hypothetical protein P4L71_13000 [Acetobacteraceae bacterium]|nr:hypothetical protein [Acetobacteraceae bacterium]
MWQQILVLVLVVVAGAWVAWTLILPRSVTARLRRLVGLQAADPACACSGCSKCGTGNRSHVKVRT